MDIYSKIASKIVNEQKLIIGPIAVEQANKVAGVSVNPTTGEVTVTGDKPKVIFALIKSYEGFFGQLSVRVSKEATLRAVANLSGEQSQLSASLVKDLGVDSHQKV